METNLKQEQLFKKIFHAIKIHQGAMISFFESTTEFLINFYTNSNLVDFSLYMYFFAVWFFSQDIAVPIDWLKINWQNIYHKM